MLFVLIRLFILMSCLFSSTTLLAASLPTFTHEVEDGAPMYAVDTNSIFEPTPQYEAKSTLGNPKSYRVAGQDYTVLDSSRGYKAIGTASWYGTKFHGRRTSNGEIYNMYAMTAASPELPLPSYVKVTNLNNHKQIIVRVNDRGPFHKNRLIDLSYVAAQKLDMLKNGTAPVRVEAIDVAPPTGQIEKRLVYLQAGAFSQFANAKRELQRLKTTLIDAPLRLHPSQHGTKTLYKIMVGPIKSVAKHTQWLQQLQLAGIDRPYPIMQ